MGQTKKSPPILPLPARGDEEHEAPAQPDKVTSDPEAPSSLIEAPVKPHPGKLKQHDFPDGGGSGGAEAFRRKPD